MNTYVHFARYCEFGYFEVQKSWNRYLESLDGRTLYQVVILNLISHYRERENLNGRTAFQAHE
jgi:hypothetical protein